MLWAPGFLRHCRRLPRSAYLPGNHFVRTKRYMAKPLDFYDGPLVWVDCEMTGLNPRKDKILEIAVIITNGKLELVDDGIQFVIRTDKKALDGMDEWCTKQHGQSGLVNACLTSPHSHGYVSKAVLAYIKKWIPYQRVGVLAGNSVHADRSFLVESMPEVVDWLHYRIVGKCFSIPVVKGTENYVPDVSSIKELSRRWYPGLNNNYKLLESNHRALDDIRGSIKELQWYRDNIFIPPPPLPPILGRGPVGVSPAPDAS